MPPEARKLLLDILDSAGEIREFTRGMDLQAYRGDAKCRAAVERKFEIIGEACTRLRDRSPSTFQQLEYGHQIIGLRNRIIHGYDSVDDAILWDVVTGKLRALVTQVKNLTD